MDGILSLIGSIISSVAQWFAAGNFNALTHGQQLEAVKSLTGLAAGVAAMPRGAELGFIRKFFAGAPMKLSPTSPENMSAGLIRWQIDSGKEIGDALSGDRAAADRAVEQIQRLGDYMAGRKK